METAEAEENCRKEGIRRLNVSGVLRILGVSRTGYHAFKTHAPSERQKNKEKRMDEIREIHAESHDIYGAPKIASIMREKGDNISDRTVGAYMKEMGIKACYSKHGIKTTAEPDFSRKLKNILKREFNPETPDAVWCTDITYIWTYEGFAYLTSIMDLFSRKIVSWVLSRTLEAEHVVEAVEKAKERRNIKSPVLLHSDRGIRYTCSNYKEATEGMVRSYSKKATPWDNACIESFHSLLKREWITRFRIRDYDHAYTLIFEYIETFYNTVRVHSHCGYKSPNEYEKIYLEKLEEEVRRAG